MLLDLTRASEQMMNAKKMFEFMTTPEFSCAIQRVIDADRQVEIAFRQDLVDAVNRRLQADERQPDAEALNTQRRFVELTMPTDEVHSVAARYAAFAGRHLPPPPPSLMLDDV